MKKIGLITLILALLFSLPVFAGEKIIEKETKIIVHPVESIHWDITLSREFYDARHFAIDWYRYNGLHAVGLKFQVMPHYFSTINCEFDQNYNDVLISLGGVYQIPWEVFFTHFHFGGEYTFSRNNLDGKPYLVFGTDFLIFFHETKIPLVEDSDLVYRGGFRFHF